MESPPSSSTWSEAFMSDDSGLLLTNSSFSSGDSRTGINTLLLEDSDCEDKSFSQDSLDGMSDIMCSENFNTLKKGCNWTDYSIKHTSPIAPPLEFQDKPVNFIVDNFSDVLASKIIARAIMECRENKFKKYAVKNYHRPPHQLLLGRSYYTSDFIPFSPCHAGRPDSRSSLGSSRLSSSHNSLSVPATRKADDSSFITQAVSHDTLSSNQISDLYNVPFDSDMYAVPIDVVKPPLKPKRNLQNKKRRRNTSSGFREIESRQWRAISTKKNTIKSERYHWCLQKETKRHSVAGTSHPIEGEPIHMTLQEVRHYLQTLYSSSSDSSDHKEKNPFKQRPSLIVSTDSKYSTDIHSTNKDITVRAKKNTFLINIKNKKVKDSCDSIGKQIQTSPNKGDKRKKTPAKMFSFKQTLCNMFRFKKIFAPEHVKSDPNDLQDRNNYISSTNLNDKMHNNISSRALPPLPPKESDEEDFEEQIRDFATSIQRVKDYGWYWGPLPSEDAEKILSNEPDGSFIVRDSSDDHYIFSLTFKLNNCVRHVRIDHDQGNFSFGSCTKFKSQTIVEFIENAVENSRSGRYLFFLHRRPVIGPVRVQLLHPVSRFKQVQSLQHICRFVIHKVVRRDLIPRLPLPRRMIDYLNTPHYYSEHLIDENAPTEQIPPRVPTPAIRQEIEELQAVNVASPMNNYIVLNNNLNARQS